MVDFYEYRYRQIWYTWILWGKEGFEAILWCVFVGVFWCCFFGVKWAGCKVEFLFDIN